MLKTNGNCLRASVIQLKTKKTLLAMSSFNNNAVNNNLESINNIKNNDIKYIVEYVKCLEERIQFMEDIIRNTLSIENDKDCENNFIN